ncbi:hypothetical protein LJR220_003391 [Bradyrhizobium sp. LjRoot220]|uniref:hypothetical protein n=1 Tax=Bradyrhizobium sp. LjRoot220 TaxID=3342284 RepID=UPI003ECD2167
MSQLSRFMSTARAVLDEQDRAKVNPNQPAFFVRTTWLFAELAELAQPGEAETFKAITIARLGGDIAACGRLVDQVHAASSSMDGAMRNQRQQLCGWIKDQIKREAVR